MKGRLPRSRVGHDRWLVSYADFITLMFAFFVVLYAFARADQKKQMQVSQAIDSAFRALGTFTGDSRGSRTQSGWGNGANDAEGGGPSNAPANRVTEVDEAVSAQVRMDLERLRGQLATKFQSQIANHAISLEMGPDGLVISLREAGFFNSGSATPKTDALPTLREIAAKLGSEPYDVRVEGHTDNVPIHNAEFESNWELSSKRATHIARLFLETKAIPPERIAAAGYAEFHPVASNDTAEGRAQNRRVDLVVMPRTKLDFRGASAAAPDETWRRVTDRE
jgi:chemotaxis protein MotB